MEGWRNKLYYGDNLEIMRDHIADGVVDLVYLDPPFNSKANYNVLFAEKNGSSSAAQIQAFEDTWHWDISSELAYAKIVQDGPQKLSQLIQALRTFLGTNDMMAYLVMMAIRLVEMRRVLKPTGSIYLHCDPTASHYIKLLMDAVFGTDCYRTEIIWSRSGGFKRSSARRFPHKHDTILLYCRDRRSVVFNPQYRAHKPEYIGRFKEDSDGRLYRDDVNPTRGGRRTIYLDEVAGDLVASTWYDIHPVNPMARERLGYPTQKPEALLERIISASSNPGDVVLDPFCGCGTTVTVAERLGRRWIGIDITNLAISLMISRLKDTFGSDLSPFEVHGVPKDLSGAKALAAQDAYQFQWWVLGQVGARPAQDKKKGSDKGIDGWINFFDDPSGQAKRVVLQVKSGHVKSGDIRDLKGVMTREGATIGVFITLEPPTREMWTEAVSAGFYVPEAYRDQKYQTLQILTVEDILAGAQVQHPRAIDAIAGQQQAPGTFKRAKRVTKGQKRQRPMV